jgi:hypothetical protein
VGPFTRNGSFEAGLLSPWTQSPGSSVAQDSNFAAHGEWFAALSQAGGGQIARIGIQQSLIANRDDGLSFLVAFAARNGPAGFDGIRVFFTAQNGDQTTFFPTNVFLTSPPLNTSTWQNYQSGFRLPETWDGGGNIFLGLQFEKSGTVVGTEYRGYLDNIVLQQIPEPTSVTLLALGGAILARHWRRQRRYTPSPVIRRTISAIPSR